MGDRKWEELPVDILVNIFERVGWVSLIEGVPYVCKSWYQVTLSPLCWQSLIFPDDFPEGYSLGSSFAMFDAYDDYGKPYRRTELYEAFIKFLIRRSRGSATVFALPSNFTAGVAPEVLITCIFEGCPSLKRLVLRFELFDPFELSDTPGDRLSRMICNWRNLEALEISGGHFSLNEIIAEISVNCNNFISLTAKGDGIYEREASAIATLLPNITFLSLRESSITRSALVIILEGCIKLMHLDVRYCTGFVVDDEILNLAAHIRTFEFGGELGREVDDYGYGYDSGYYYDDYYDSGYYDYVSD